MKRIVFIGEGRIKTARSFFSLLFISFSLFENERDDEKKKKKSFGLPKRIENGIIVNEMSNYGMNNEARSGAAVI